MQNINKRRKGLPQASQPTWPLGRLTYPTLRLLPVHERWWRASDHHGRGCECVAAIPRFLVVYKVAPTPSSLP